MMNTTSFANATVNPTQATMITHGGVFHADEVMATAILHLTGMEVSLARVFRVPEDANPEAIVFDVGGGKYDHHQRGGNGVRENGVPYSSAGLIWRDFGQKICSEAAWELVDRELIQGIDAIDNGTYPAVVYPIQATSVSHLISAFNPNWDSEENSDDAFFKALGFAIGILERAVESAESKARAAELVNRAVAESEDQVVILPRFAPWQEYLLASEDPKAEGALYVIFPSNRGGFNVQAIPDAIGSFGNRKPLPSSWAGLRDEQLREASGVTDAIFCHPGRFIGAAESLEGAKQLARLAIAEVE